MSSSPSPPLPFHSYRPSPSTNSHGPPPPPPNSHNSQLTPPPPPPPSRHRNLNPGGTAEFQDFNLLYYSEDGSLTPQHALLEWISTLTGAADKLGRDSNPGSKLEGWARAAGFAGVVHRRYRVPIGPWARDKTLKEVGAWNLMQVLNGLEGLSMRLYTGVLGWSEAEVWALLERVRRDLADPRVHALFDL